MSEGNWDWPEIREVGIALAGQKDGRPVTSTGRLPLQHLMVSDAPKVVGNSRVVRRYGQPGDRQAPGPNPINRQERMDRASVGIDALRWSRERRRMAQELDSFGRKANLSVDRLVRQVMLMPYSIENAESACKSHSQNPSKVPHVPSSIEIGRIALDLSRGHRPAHGVERDRCVDEYNRQKDQRRQQHHEKRELARRCIPHGQARYRRDIRRHEEREHANPRGGDDAKNAERAGNEGK
jgi:hypothetical protein